MAKNDEPVGARATGGDATSMHGITINEIGMLDAVDLPIIVIGRDCTVARMNRAATTVLGMRASDVGCSIGDALAGVENLGRACARVIADGAPHRVETRD